MPSTTSPPTLSSVPPVSPDAIPAPVLVSLSPTEGPTKAGSTVTLSGSSLSGATKVKFGKAGAVITSDSATQITVIAPAGAAGTVKVKVTTDGGTSVASPADEYTYVVAPTVTKLSPTSGSSAGGTVVTVTGTNLSGASVVLFGSNPGALISDSATKITATSPPGSIGKANVPGDDSWGHLGNQFESQVHLRHCSPVAVDHFRQP